MISIADIERQLESSKSLERQLTREAKIASLVANCLGGFGTVWMVVLGLTGIAFWAMALAAYGIHLWCKRLLNVAIAEKWSLVHELGRRNQEEWDAIEDRITKESGVHVKRDREYVNGEGRRVVQ